MLPAHPHHGVDGPFVLNSALRVSLGICGCGLHDRLIQMLATIVDPILQSASVLLVVYSDGMDVHYKTPDLESPHNTM